MSTGGRISITVRVDEVAFSGSLASEPTSDIFIIIDKLHYTLAVYLIMIEFTQT